MGRNNYFQFKQFKIVQEKAAMKVGIDGVLLGAWVNLVGATYVLDIGTGTGLLALMAAQRSNAKIDAVEIEPEAASEAAMNVVNSIFKDRIDVHACSFQEFDSILKYSHIISNPPFFQNSFPSTDQKRTKARHDNTLTLQELLTKAKSLLAENGIISMILPTEKEARFRILVKELDLNIIRLAHVSPDEDHKPHRIMIELSNGKSEMSTSRESIFIRNAATQDFSKEYQELTKDFYLAF